MTISLGILSAVVALAFFFGVSLGYLAGNKDGVKDAQKGDPNDY
jgi:ABC-type dipeptide/oligopeptide/nickel transport system permease subunit